MSKIHVSHINSANIRAEAVARRIEYVEEIGTYQHPAHLDSRDWDVTIYDLGEYGRVAATNGDPIWEGVVEFTDLLAEYGIDLS